MIGGHLLRRPLADDAAALEQIEMIDDLQRRLDVLLDQQHRQAAIDQEADARQQVGDQPRRQTRRRLVQHQHARPGEQRAADRQHLPLAAGERRALVMAPLGEPREEVEDVGDGEEMAVFGIGRRPHQREILVDRELGKDVLAFRHQREPAPHPLMRGETGDILRLPA